MNELLTKLFNYRSTFTYNDIPFYIQVVGESDLSEARDFALLESRKFRNRLRDEGSDDYLRHIDIVKDFADDMLRVGILKYAGEQVAREYVRMTPLPKLDMLPDYPEQEDHEEFVFAMRERDKTYFDDMTNYVADRVKDLTVAIEKLDRSQLETLYIKYYTDRLCEGLFTIIFEDYITASGVYKDEAYTQRAFTYAEFKALQSDTKSAFKTIYNRLTLANDELKK